MSKAHEDPDRYMSTEIPVDLHDMLNHVDSFPSYPDEDTPVDIQEAIAEAIAILTEEEWFVLESNLIRKVALRVLAETLGYSKTKVWQVRETAKGKLVRHLMADRSVTDRYGLEPTWNDAARAALMELAPTGKVLNLNPLQWQWDSLKKYVAEDEPIMICHVLGTIARMAAAELDADGEWSLTEMERLLCSKQNDYGHENILAFGMVGLGVRMSDKIARYFNLQGRSAANESLLDTKRDMVGYGAIAEMLRNKTFMLPLVWNEN